MIWLVALVAFTLVVTVREYLRYKENFPAVMAFIVAGGFGGLVAVLIALVVGQLVYDEDTYSYTFPVVDAADGSNINGRFSVFGGYIEEKPYYFFYRENADGGIYQGKIPANDTLIYEDQETQNYIHVTKCHEELEFWGVTPGCEPTYEIHVPEGSVDRNVNFDLE